MATAQFCGGDYEGTIATLREMIELKPSVRGFRKLLVLALREVGRETDAAQEEARASTLDNGENFCVQEPAIPETHLWIRKALAPVLE
ncbi:MAG: hypothetical protein WAO69_06415 [Aestuariivita sp.]|uniref:hypothetical protein n=1 Tax=Aestuariivita sp. TaxID=1872407 RepID=UPI003BAE5279